MIKIQENIVLANHTTLHIGGVARYYVEVASKEELLDVVDYAKERELPVLFLGGGSNLLISDSGFSGMVIKNSILGIEANQENQRITLKVGSGEVLDDVVAYTVAKGWWGMENLTSIPGTVGATPVQNVGAYGVEVAELIKSVKAINIETKEEKVFSNSECKFGYRDSVFKTEIGKNFFITEVELYLSTEVKQKISYADLQKYFTDNTSPTQNEIREAVKNIRAQKFPDWTKVGTAGSFFKNPLVTKEHYEQLQMEYPDLPGYESEEGMVKISLGYVLDKVCGLKGYRDGKVGLSEAQALVLINYEDASAEEVKHFVEKIKEKVFEKTKIKIYPEVIFVN